MKSIIVLIYIKRRKNSRMKGVLVLTLMLTISLMSFGQDYPVYNQYFNNPFLLNAGYVGSSGYTEISTTHRRQWIGIEDAPVFTTLTLQYPTRKGVSLGLGINSQSSVMLRRTSALLTFGYEVLLGETHSLRFGLSGGLGNYNLDISKISDQSLNDNAIGKYLGSRYFFDGQFGIVYSLKKFHLGFAVPRLFDTKTFTQSQLNNVSFGELKYSLLSVSYKFGNSEEGISFEPYVIYRMANTKKEWEGLGTIYYKNTLWIGGSYRQQYGPTAFLGFAVKNFKFGYSYEIPTSEISKYSKGSHEIQLNLRLGKDKRRGSSEKVIAKTDPTHPVTTSDNTKQNVREETTIEQKVITEKPQEDKAHKTESKIVENNKVTTVETIKNSGPTDERVLTEIKTIEKSPVIIKDPPIREIKVEAKVSSHPLELKEGNYVVVGVFKSPENAANYTKQLKAKAYTSSVGYSSKTSLHYVYLSKHLDIQEARKKLGIRKIEMFKSVWIMRVQ